MRRIWVDAKCGDAIVDRVGRGQRPRLQQRPALDPARIMNPGVIVT
jgi:hypothetical protein